MIGMVRALAAAWLVTATALAGASVISYTANFPNSAGVATDFSLAIETPIVPQTGLSSWSFAGIIALIDGEAPGVSASVSGLPEFWRLEVADASNVFSIVDDVGGTDSLTSSGPFLFTASGLFDCAAIGGCFAMRLTLSFLLSPFDELLSLGIFELAPTPVPEPGTLALLGLGLAALVVAAARRRLR